MPTREHIQREIQQLKGAGQDAVRHKYLKNLHKVTKRDTVVYFSSWSIARPYPVPQAAVSVRPRLLDLFCCAGGAGMGYARAGFEIIGVDVVRHTNNPHPVIEADALALDPGWIAANFDAVHASPPCQGYTTMRHAPGAKGAPRLIGQTRELLRATGLPWVIENVEAAAHEMQNPVLLCGTMFGLGAQGHELQRHRLFETSFQVAPLACRHTDAPVIGVYGGHARNRAAKHGGRGTKDTWDGGHRAAASEALGIDWMNLAEMSEAIPPAYTEYLGWQLRAALMLARAANAKGKRRRCLPSA